MILLYLFEEFFFVQYGNWNILKIKIYQFHGIFFFQIRLHILQLMIMLLRLPYLNMKITPMEQTDHDKNVNNQGIKRHFNLVDVVNSLTG